MRIKIRKRFVISFIITAIVVVLTNRYWLVFKPFPVDLDISGSGSYNIEVDLNKKNIDDFESSKFETEKVTLNGEKRVHFDVIRARFPKRFRFLIMEIYNKEPITVSNVILKDKSLEITDLDKFTIYGAKPQINDNKLVLNPTGDVIEIIYKDTLDVSTLINFEISLLIIIMVLTFLLAYKISDYIADFNTIQEKSRIEIVFLTIFFAFLIVPISHIDNSEISKEENRTLAPWKPLVVSEGVINYNFGKDFDAWFNDRFNFRTRFIDAYDMRHLLSKYWITKKVIKGKNGWLFYNEEGLEAYTNEVMFKEDELKLIAKYLNSIDDYCNKNGKKFYFVIAPDKSKVYGEFYSDKISQVQEYSRANQLVDYLKKNTNIKVIYPLENIIKNKNKGLLYFKQDTHWTYMGAYYAYEELIKLMQKDYKDIYVSIPKKFKELGDKHASDLKTLTPDILRFEDDGKYVIPDTKLKIAKCSKESTIPKATINCTNDTQQMKLLSFTDSFGRYFVDFLSDSFGESKWVWQYNFEPLIMKDADVIVLEILERFLPKLTDVEVNKYAF